MRRLLVAAAVLGALVGPAAAGAATTKVVVIGTAGFKPATVTIQTGDRITWRNADSKKHQVVADGGAFASPTLGAGKTWSRTFTRAATFAYHDSLYPARKGKVVVKQRPVPPAVSLAATPAVVRYGETTRLSGQVSSGKANELVAVFARRAGEPSFVQLATVLTATSGAWAYDVRPTLLTSYQVRYRGVVSGEAVVQVQPRVRLLGSRTHFYVHVDAARSFARHYVVLQRLAPNGTWVGVRRLQLGRHAGRLFPIPKRRGTTVYRAFLAARQAGEGYLASWSGTQQVRRR